ncbi:hypothetical protein ACFL6F_02120 [Planctomycetota bacterium]
MHRDEFIYRIAETEKDLEGAMQLVYHNYVEKGFCGLNRFHMHFYLFDVLPETRTLVALRRGKVVATLTLVFDSELGLPSDHLYKKTLDTFRNKGRRIAEISKLSADLELGVGQIEVVKGLFRLAWITAGKIRNATDFCVMVEPRHERFYKHSYLSDRIGELKEDHEAGGAQSLLLLVDLEKGPEKLKEKYGTEYSSRNLYWYNCIDPEVEKLTEGALETDSRLFSLNKRIIENKGQEEHLSDAEHRYIDFRIFALTFNADKVSKDAGILMHKGFFRREIDVYEKLLKVFPFGYLKERRVKIYIDIASAACHCGMYDKCISLCNDVIELTDKPEFKAEAHATAGVALYFQGKYKKAEKEFSRAADTQGIGPFERLRVLHKEMRMALDMGKMDHVRSVLTKAFKLHASCDKTRESDIEYAHLLHLTWILEQRCGNITAGGQALEKGREFFLHTDDKLKDTYWFSMSSMSYQSGNPKEALDYVNKRIKDVPLEEDPLNNAVNFNHRGVINLSLGNVQKAEKDVLNGMQCARRSYYKGGIAYGISVLVPILIALGNLTKAQDTFKRAALEIGFNRTPREKMLTAIAEADIAMCKGEWIRAREVLTFSNDFFSAYPSYGSGIDARKAENELLAGNRDEGLALGQKLQHPDEFPGLFLYKRRWLAIKAVLALMEGDPSGSIQYAQDVLSAEDESEAWCDLSESGFFIAEAVKALGLQEAGIELMEMCLNSVKKAIGAAELPRAADRLAALE